MRTALPILTLLYLSVARHAQETSAALLNSSNYKPTVNLSYGAFQGNTTGNVDEFLGIPFAAPPYVPLLSLFLDHLTITHLLPLTSVSENFDSHTQNPH